MATAQGPSSILRKRERKREKEREREGEREREEEEERVNTVLARPDIQ